MGVLVKLIFEPRSFVCALLELIHLAREIRHKHCLLVEFGFGHRKVIFALLAITLLPYQLYRLRSIKHACSQVSTQTVDLCAEYRVSSRVRLPVVCFPLRLA